MNLPDLLAPTRSALLVAAIGTLTASFACPSSARAEEEPEESSLLYEDDAWYDVTEWFDGNDYNPVDEAIGRWDDEVYDVTDAVTSSDRDSDIDWGRSDYGYYSGNNINADDDWFYDYYDYGYYEYDDYDSNELYEHTARYYDYDRDGFYDAYTSVWDTNGDGIYDEYSYITFADPKSDQAKQRASDAKKQQSDRGSKSQSVSGNIKSLKQVQTPTGTNLVVMLSGTQNNRDMVIDLGPTQHFDQMPRMGENITATGVALKTGDKSVLLAQSIKRNGESRAINRTTHQYTGTVQSAKKAKVRGREHQLVRVETKNGKKLLADLGPASSIGTQIKQGAQITVGGPAIKIDNRPVLIARNATIDGKTIQIQRNKLN